MQDRFGVIKEPYTDEIVETLPLICRRILDMAS